MSKSSLMDGISQYAIPLFTVGGYALTGLKYPQWGMLISLAAQPFWLYSSHKSYKKAGQSGMFISSVIMTFVILFGVLNYWVL